jgi:hypothetical protein
MNKKAKKRAFFICAAIFVLYIAVGLGLTEKLSKERIASAGGLVLKDMNLSSIPKASALEESLPATTPTPRALSTPKPPPITPAPKPPATEAPKSRVPEPEHPVTRAAQPAPPAEQALAPPLAFMRDGSKAEPSLFISVPVICYAIKAGLIEKEGLISVRKEGYNTLTWKKPLDILIDKDEEGLRSLSKAIGKKQILGFLEKEGITHVQENGTGDIILGKGYGVEKAKLIGLYNKYVSEDYRRILPYTVDGVGITKGRNGFEFIRSKDVQKEHHDKGAEEWMMPNLVNLTLREALEKLSNRTSRIKIFGSGNVTDQQPRPFQKVNEETECIIYGRVGR